MTDYIEQHTPCFYEPDLFTSDSPELQRMGAKLCHGDSPSTVCPLLKACRQSPTALTDRDNVYGGLTAKDRRNSHLYLHTPGSVTTVSREDLILTITRCQHDKIGHVDITLVTDAPRLCVSTQRIVRR